ncbi:DUF6194 family protein [soil metagenome]
MDENDIRKYILKTFQSVDVIEDLGNFFFIFDPKNKIPFVTIVTNNKYDNYSDLDRRGVFRLNIGIGKETYRSMFPVDKIPTESGYDFSALNKVMPHPEYGRVYWVCVLNPSESTFNDLLPMLDEAYQRAIRKYKTAQFAEGLSR